MFSAKAVGYKYIIIIILVMLEYRVYKFRDFEEGRVFLSGLGLEVKHNRYILPVRVPPFYPVTNRHGLISEPIGRLDDGALSFYATTSVVIGGYQNTIIKGLEKLAEDLSGFPSDSSFS